MGGSCHPIPASHSATQPREITATRDDLALNSQPCLLKQQMDQGQADPKSPRKQTIHRNPDRPHRKLHQKQNLHQVRTIRRSLPSHQNPPRYTRLQKDSSTTWMIRSTPTWAIAPPTPPRSLTLMGFQKSRRHEETWREPY